MPQRNAVPKYRKQKRPNGRHVAFVEVDGRRVYLGDYNTPESRQRYARLLDEREVGGRVSATPSGALTINELSAQFWAWAETYYVKPNRDTTCELEMFRTALRPLVELYGATRACDFSPLGLKAVRNRMVKAGWCRTYINKQVIRLKRVFKWAGSEELLDASVYHSLQTVAGLKRGRTKAPESEPVQAVPDSLFDATLPHLTPTVRAMAQIHRLTGMRPGEVCTMRTADLNMTGQIWIYSPQYHKTQHHGRTRLIYIGPKGQSILRPWLRTDLQAYLFSPIQSETERREARTAARKTPVGQGNGPGSNRKVHPKWGPNAKYTADTYAGAVRYACAKAFPPPGGLSGDGLKGWRRDHWWSPGRLRHSFATEVRREHGLEAAQVLLGHVRADITQIYAERDVARALEVARRIG